MANEEYTVEFDEIRATLVPNERRLSVLPKYMSDRFMIVGEQMVYSWMRALCPTYDGGLWDFVELSNGGFFMSPWYGQKLDNGVEGFKVEVRGNGYTGTMSAEAAGITACLFAYGQLANQTAQAHFIDLRDNLRDFAKQHFECSEILAAID